MSVLGGGMSAQAAEPEPQLTQQGPGRAPVAAQILKPQVSEKQLKIMAETSDSSVAQQRARVAKEFASNNALARLRQEGFIYRQGAFLDDTGKLVVRAKPGSRAARAAVAEGAKVQPAEFGELALRVVQKELVDAGMDNVAAVEVDVPGDRVVVRKTGSLDAATTKIIAKNRDAVVVKKSKELRPSLTVLGGDAVYNTNGARCSAGFPARESNGNRYMIWAGHCVEGGTQFYSSNEWIGRFAATAYGSNDGRPDRDIGAISIENEDSVSKNSQSWNSGWSTDGQQGASKPAIGTTMCKSGSTSGITCGRIQGYNVSVNYGNAAQLSGLMSASVCTASGDSGGAFTAGGYAVGMTSGGPTGQSCTFNGGWVNGSSYVQPVTDALNYYGLQYGH